MQILEIHIASNNLAQQAAFYGQVLGLPVIRYTPARLGIQIGQSQLWFIAVPLGEQPRYHLAFNIPSNQYEAAYVWLKQRIALLHTSDGRDQFVFEAWRAEACYFADPQGNILELIARQAIPAAQGTFGSHQFLSISELGLAGQPMPELRQLLIDKVGLAPFGDYDDQFTALGDDHGLFILVERGRIWMPGGEAACAAELIPVRVLMEHAHQRYTISGAPYRVALL